MGLWTAVCIYKRSVVNTELIVNYLSTTGLQIGLKILAAIAVWVIGKFVINGISGMAKRLMEKRNVEPTLVRYLHSALRIALTILLIIAVLGLFGIETTSFAAMLAAAGVAIGMAWSGLLANFAAGVFLLILKPFRVGDLIGGAGLVGTVKELGMFATKIETVDGIVTFVGNGKLLGDNIQNMSQSAERRVDLFAQVAHGVDPQDAKRRLVARIAQIPNVLVTPGPTVEILEFNAMGTLLAVRPFCDNAFYWDVYFATNAAIAEVCGAAGYPAPEQRYSVWQRPTAM